MPRNSYPSSCLFSTSRVRRAKNLSPQCEPRPQRVEDVTDHRPFVQCVLADRDLLFHGTEDRIGNVPESVFGFRTLPADTIGVRREPLCGLVSVAKRGG